MARADQLSRSLADELDGTQMRFHVGDWPGHTETMLDATGAVTLVREFIASLDVHPI